MPWTNVNDRAQFSETKQKQSQLGMHKWRDKTQSEHSLQQNVCSGRVYNYMSNKHWGRRFWRLQRCHYRRNTHTFNPHNTKTLKHFRRYKHKTEHVCIFCSQQSYIAQGNSAKWVLVASALIIMFVAVHIIRKLYMSCCKWWNVAGCYSAISYNTVALVLQHAHKFSSPFKFAHTENIVVKLCSFLNFRSKLSFWHGPSAVLVNRGSNFRPKFLTTTKTICQRWLLFCDYF